jgi:hypothetical protein
LNTPYSDIYSLFLVNVRDYKIDKLSLTPVDLANYLEGFLIMAIPEFYNCNQDLSDRDDSAQIFNIDLTLEEEKILSNWMTYYWFAREVQDVTQFNLHLNDTDFKHYAEANNLQSKQSYLNGLREIYMQRTVDYGIKSIDWTNWKAGLYG